MHIVSAVLAGMLTVVSVVVIAGYLVIRAVMVDIMSGAPDGKTFFHAFFDAVGIISDYAMVVLGFGALLAVAVGVLNVLRAVKHMRNAKVLSVNMQMLMQQAAFRPMYLKPYHLAWSIVGTLLVLPLTIGFMLCVEFDFVWSLIATVPLASMALDIISWCRVRRMVE